MRHFVARQFAALAVIELVVPILVVVMPFESRPARSDAIPFSCRQALKDELAGAKGFRIGRVRIATRGVVDLVAIGPRERIYETT